MDIDTDKDITAVSSTVDIIRLEEINALVDEFMHTKDVSKVIKYIGN